MQVKDKRVVITGAASGIGKALSVAFHKAGAQSVVAVDMNIEGVVGDIKLRTSTVNGEYNPSDWFVICLLYTSPSPRDYAASRMPSSA